MVKNPPVQEMHEFQVWSLGQEDPLEKEMTTYSSILAWKNHMDRGAWQATVQGVTKSQTRSSMYTEPPFWIIWSYTSVNSKY